jgi:hypothetical protein
MPPPQTLAVQVAPVPGHWAAVSHSTQRPLAASQMGNWPPVEVTHCVLAVHPAWQLCVVALQAGVAAGQSVLAKQATQVADAVSHSLSVISAAQSALAPHCTHCWVVASHTGRAAVLQSVAVRHPTHAPVVVSQMGDAPRLAQFAPPSPVQAARHVWVAGSQTWLAAQSVSAPHASQLPRTQTLRFALKPPAGGQFVLVRHCTHPRVSLHC